tara:strand:+ start:479 stop:2581 length:2103 start_codon:yes stop_codon:yes gene_type:complete
MELILELFKYLGKLHPVVLHLPIGALIMTFVLLLIAKFQKIDLYTAIRIGVDFSFIGALIAALLGYFLSLDDDYDFNNLSFHFWSGIVTLILSFALSVLHRAKGKENIFFACYILTLISLTITGHKGGIITHGEDYLSPEGLYEVSPPVILKDSILLYEAAVNLILDDKCVSCHNASKSKSGLRFDRYDLMMKGGERGSLFDPDNHKEGSLVKFISLPIEDELHMPPKNKTQLNERELWLLNYWVSSGEYLKSSPVALSSNDTLKNNILAYLGLEKKVAPADRKALGSLASLGFRIHLNAFHDNLLKLKFLKKNLEGKHIKHLREIKNQIVELDLSNTNFNDLMSELISDLPNLKTLRLDQTDITDKTLGLLNNSNLEVLNLCNTKVTYKGLNNLTKIEEAPKTIYAWNTAVSNEDQVRLMALSSSTINFGSSEMFSEMLRLSTPDISFTNNIFNDSIVISFADSQLKNIDTHYTLDESEPNEISPVYEHPITLTSSARLRAKSIKKGWHDSEMSEIMFIKNNNYETEFALKSDLDKDYGISHGMRLSFKGNDSILFDKQKGDRISKGVSSEEALTWLGVREDDFIVEVKLKENDKINFVTISALENVDMDTMFPQKIEVYGKNTNGDFDFLNSIEIPIDKNIDDGNVTDFRDFTIPLNLNNYEEVKLIGKNYMEFPDLPVFHKKRKRKVWIFIDEIIFW